jgi:hypothetical protein
MIIGMAEILSNLNIKTNVQIFIILNVNNLDEFDKIHTGWNQLVGKYIHFIKTNPIVV